MKFDFRGGGRYSPLAKGLHILPFVFASLVAVGCSRTSSQKSITLSEESISPQPPRVGPIKLKFKLADAGRPVTGARIALEGDMTHAGMAPVFGDTKEVSPGQYQGEVNLNMGGDWVMLLHITLPDGRKAERQINVNGVQSR